MREIRTYGSVRGELGDGQAQGEALPTRECGYFIAGSLSSYKTPLLDPSIMCPSISERIFIINLRAGLSDYFNAFHSSYSVKAGVFPATTVTVASPAFTPV